MYLKEFSDTFPEMDATTQFLSEIKRFLERTGMTPGEFGRQTVNDGSFLKDIKTGRTPNLRTVQKIRDYIATHSKGNGSN